MKSNPNLKKDFSRFQREKSWFMNRKTHTQAGLIILGIISTAWFLFRVIPKPSRAHYPCMQVAAPFASAFLLYITGLFSTVVAFKKLKKYFSDQRYVMSGFIMIIILAGILMILINGTINLNAKPSNEKEVLNDPIGIARGIFPGRVVWVWNPDATSENCTNTPGDYWWQNENNDQQVIEEMLSDAIRTLTGETNDSLAWDAIFRDYNMTHGNGNTGYTPGQKIAIKVNITTGGWGNVDTLTYEKISLIDYMDGTPQLILAMLKQLVEVVGVEQSDISIGDPIRLFFDHYWDMCHNVYPDIHYLDWEGKLGRTKVELSPEPVLFYSDDSLSDHLPTAYTEASYMINMGCLKQHDLAGGTFCAKNHFGSICRDWASHLHYALPSPTTNGFENLGYGKFRNLVDLMEHHDLGEKTVLFLVDGLWGGDLPVCKPFRWQMQPFNNDWPSSIIVSQDHVAIESVGFDFIRAELDVYAHMEGADDYLHQAADSANWAEGITYDPENDGILIASMGTHEHWNNDIDKQYSRNLGTGDGIELVQRLLTSLKEADQSLFSHLLINCFPDPFGDKTSLEIKDNAWINADKVVSLYNSQMQCLGTINWGKNQPLLVIERNGLPAGLYYFTVYFKGNQLIGSGKMIVSD